MDKFYEVAADHFTICRPSSSKAQAFIGLQDCIGGVLARPQVGS